MRQNSDERMSIGFSDREFLKNFVIKLATKSDHFLTTKFHIGAWLQ